MIKLLDGMRVVELASYMMGPIAGRVLGEWGAEVIKIEPALKKSTPGAPPASVGGFGGWGRLRLFRWSE